MSLKRLATIGTSAFSAGRAGLIAWRAFFFAVGEARRRRCRGVFGPEREFLRIVIEPVGNANQVVTISSLPLWNENGLVFAAGKALTVFSSVLK